jgi:hypothetical protein
MVNHASDEDACPEEHRDEGPLLVAQACPPQAGFSLCEPNATATPPASRSLS